jgi:adenylate kinase
VADAAEASAGSLRVVLLGPPNCGKGTQAGALSQRLGVPAISTGDMLREAVKAGSELGRKVEGIMAAGALVDDETIDAVVRERLGRLPDEGGFLLDGYPRTVVQARTLEDILESFANALGNTRGLDAVLLVQVPDSELVRRALGRGRPDDREEVVRERLRVYREKTEPLIGYYRERGLLREIDGNRPVSEVTAQLLGALGVRDEVLG